MTSRTARHFKLMSGGLLCLIATALPVHGHAQPQFAFSGITSTISPSKKIGKIKQGFICAPKGALRFGDLQRADDGQLRQRIAALSASTDIVVDLPDSRFPNTPQTTTHALVGRLGGLSLDLCVPGANIGVGSRRSKGSGIVTVTWEVWRQSDKKLIAQRTLETPVKLEGADPRRSSEALEQYLAQSAVQFLAATSDKSDR